MPEAGAQVACQGTPLNLNHLVAFNTVQESSATSWTIPSSSLLAPPIDASPFSLYCRFTDFSSLEQTMIYVASGSYSTMNVNFKDCQFHGGTIDLEYGAGLTNNLFERVYCTLQGYDTNALTLQNNLFWNGTYDHESIGSNDVVENNLFYQTTMFDVGGTNFTFGWNGFYHLTAYDLQATNSHDQFLTTDPNFQPGPLGKYYLPTGCPLIDMGSDAANNLTLYHYTVKTNQVKEISTTVDIGYHYMALNTSGLPVDTDGDGIPDYVEDSNGDGNFQAGIDLSNWRHNPATYISQAGAGANNGHDAGDAQDMTWLNNYVNWGTGAFQINPGDTIHLVGTITNSMLFLGSGTPGSNITLLFEPNAKMSAPTLASSVGNPSPGWIYTYNNSNLVINGGSNGIIELTDNGTPAAHGGTKTYNYNVTAIEANNGNNTAVNNISVLNLTIKNLYLRQTNAEYDYGTGAGILLTGSDCLISNCMISECETPISLAFSGALASNLTIWGCTFSNFNHGISVGSGNTGAQLNNLLIVSNKMYSGDMFETADYFYTTPDGQSHNLASFQASFIGPWNSTTSYLFASNSIVAAGHDATTGNPYLFICLSNNTNIDPTIATNTNYWSLFQPEDLGYHRDPIIFFGPTGSYCVMSNVTIACNFIKAGDTPLSSTAGTGGMFHDGAAIYEEHVYNNLVITTAPLSWSGGGGPFSIAAQGGFCANNTSVCWETNGVWHGGNGFSVAGGNLVSYNNINLSGGGEWLAVGVDTNGLTYNTSNIVAGFVTNTLTSDFNIFNYQGANSFVELEAAHPSNALWGGQDNIVNSLYEFVTYFGNPTNLEVHSSTSLVQLDSNCRPLPTDTVARLQGTNLSYFFNTDINGNPRPTNGNWTIGAFEVP